MTRILNANLKKFLGAKYERVPQSFIIWVVFIFIARSMELSLAISPFILWLATVFATVGGFVQVLNADDTIDSLRGQLMLPESFALFHAAFSLSVVIYVLLTKAGLLLAGFLALSGFNLTAVIGFFVCFTICGAVTYPLAFRSEKRAVPYRYVNNNRHNFAAYLIRYLLQNKPYLSNTAVLWAFGCAFAYFTSSNGFPNILPLGLAIMCLNTPLGILLSGDKALYKQTCLLPCQTVNVFIPYALFVAGVNAIGCGMYLTAWRLITGMLNPVFITMAALYAIISGFLTVVLEIKFPLLDWKVQSDLWHHPRKFVVPGIMILLSLPMAMLMGGM